MTRRSLDSINDKTTVPFAQTGAPVRAWNGSVGGVRLVSFGGATSLLPVIDLFFSAYRMRPVRTRQAQARR